MKGERERERHRESKKKKRVMNVSGKRLFEINRGRFDETKNKKFSFFVFFFFNKYFS